MRPPTTRASCPRTARSTSAPTGSTQDSGLTGKAGARAVSRTCGSSSSASAAAIGSSRRTPTRCSQAGDIASISGPRPCARGEGRGRRAGGGRPGPARHAGDAGRRLRRNKAINGKTLRELADLPDARGIYLRKITRNMVDIPILPETEILRGDILNDRRQHAARRGGRGGRWVTPTARPRRRISPSSSAGIVVGGLVGALSHRARAASRSACRRRAVRCSPGCCSATCAPSTRRSATSRRRRCGS